MKRKVLALVLGMLVLTVGSVYADDDVDAAVETDATVTEFQEEQAEPEETTEVFDDTADEDLDAEEQTEVFDDALADGSDAEKPTRVSRYKREEDGSLRLDERGNPIPIIYESDTKKPVVWLRDNDEELVLDQWGEPVATQYVDIAAEVIETIEDVLNPSRSIDIYASWEGEELYFGAEAKLTAVLHGYDNVVYTIQWENSKNGTDWHAVENGRGLNYTLIVTQENYLDFWRVRVTVTGVDQEGA